MHFNAQFLTGANNVRKLLMNNETLLIWFYTTKKMEKETLFFHVNRAIKQHKNNF